MLQVAAASPDALLALRPTAAAVVNLLHQPLNLPSPRLRHSVSFHRHNISTSHSIPRIVVCHGKLDGSYGAKPEPMEMGEAFFDGIGAMMEGGIDEDGYYDDDDDDETESSIDLFLRLMQSWLKKISKRAKRASRSVLPSVLSPQLVSFAVDGVLALSVLFIFKSLLQVFCTLGTTIFVGVLLVRVVWAVVSYLQANGNDDGRSFSGTSRAAMYETKRVCTEHVYQERKSLAETFLLQQEI
ncbi:unnamed protein product [Linum trigynum]|uniref:Protein SHORT HYPOCOTYL IN WHITE LIGHT 1 n=1 Tax=Linum trigynum TaxID=586398 RepID=A0AAV2CL51_9ROSI